MFRTQRNPDSERQGQQNGDISGIWMRNAQQEKSRYHLNNGNRDISIRPH